MDMFSFSWWFGTIPLYTGQTLRLFFLVFLTMIILGSIVRMVSKRRLADRFQIEVAKRSASLLVVSGILGLWYWFVASQQIPFLSARFWLPLLAILFIWWAVRIVRYARVTVPAERERLQKTKEVDKYMQPKRKN